MSYISTSFYYDAILETQDIHDESARLHQAVFFTADFPDILHVCRHAVSCKCPSSKLDIALNDKNYVPASLHLKGSGSVVDEVYNQSYIS